MSATCHVTAKDYRREWGGEVPHATPAPAYTGPDRRSGQDRRVVAHDRRWFSDPLAGRRRRDRRKR